MAKTVVVYYSGYGHTKVIAEAAAQASDAQLIAIDADGNVPEHAWDTLTRAQAIIFGTPTYMGSVPWQFKKFADASSKKWFTREWQDKVFGGFTNSASLNGDKQVTLIYLQTLASQHGGIWVSLGMLPANTKSATRDDVNNLGGSVGALVQSPSDSSVEEVPAGDLETVRRYAKRVSDVAKRLQG
ncbi:NAD(P)H-dependent oxidoreductase [Trinickia caryophylli]|uniref:Flavoprotein WrbA n=1 Tax=Trinickia caryophylli TaxID=28094 RepID=A0A1X7DM27_TRICW|nr:NAD(P)H-dependent oxidoreductase [Trinickia caryophylli]PMS10671.1 NADPH-dependent FMN reductase [Trinickia caryophylli]TRX17142.1 NADPH-dependent FMN reductase [Trinickia caryophylli]WQE12124.1 NAD(P)H-dependent oxidoreductase [Trinickia caryophylli]SMF17848.1 Multimeric flavodoxin WrbA [Trinickia caryophylli]GLU31747.1 FMN reductase [Trinickia caryophylli]